LPTKNYGKKLVRCQCWTKCEEGNGTGLDTIRRYSGHHKATEKEGDQETLEKRSGERNVDSRIQVQLEEDGGSSTR